MKLQYVKFTKMLENRITRREFLAKLTGLTGALIMVGCVPREDRPTPQLAPSPDPTKTALQQRIEEQQAIIDKQQAEITSLKAPTKTPEQLLPNQSAVFNFSEGVPENQREEIKKTTFQVLDWFNSKIGISLSQVTVFSDDNPQRIIEQYLLRTNFSEDQKALERKNLLQATSFAGQRNDFYIITSRGGWTKASPIIGGPVAEGRVHTIVHEIFHLIQKKFMAYQRLFPYWLWEGSAHYVAARFLAETNRYDYQKIVSGHISESSRMSERLQSLESNQFYNAGTPFADEYSLGFLATQYLTKDLPDGGTKELVKFWQEVGKGTDWKIAFGQVFGKTTQQYYAGFETFRQQGFK